MLVSNALSLSSATGHMHGRHGLFACKIGCKMADMSCICDYAVYVLMTCCCAVMLVACCVAGQHM